MKERREMSYYNCSAVKSYRMYIGGGRGTIAVLVKDFSAGKQ